MDLGTKKKALNALVQVDHLETDIELLKANKSHSRVLKGKYPTRERHQREVLWELLSVISPTDIETNRKFAASAKGAAKDNADKNANEGNSGNDDADQKAKEAAALKAKEEVEKAAELAAAKEELKVLDLDDKPDYQLMKRLVKILAIETENMEKVTLVAALKAFRGDKPEGENDTAEELNAAKTELEETKGDLEEKEQELEDTQDELAETQQQLEEKEQELNDAKKNETANSAKTGNTPT